MNDIERNNAVNDGTPTPENVVSLAQFKQQLPQSDAPDDIPDFITPKSIEDMTEEQQDQLVHYIRMSRVAASTLAAHTRKDVASGRVSAATTQNRLVKKCEMIAKKIEQIGKQQEMLERYFQELRGLRLQAAMDPDG